MNRRQLYKLADYKLRVNSDTCGRGKIESPKKSLRIQKYPTRMDRALKKLNGVSQACLRERHVNELH